MTQPAPCILIVDDDAAIRTLLAAVLTREGLEFEVVQNGQEAIDRLTLRNYDAVLLDLMMPFMTGFDVIEHMEQHAPDQLAKSFIILTAASKRDMKGIEGRAVFRVLRKPFELSELLSSIRECVGIVPPVREAGTAGGVGSQSVRDDFRISPRSLDRL